MKYMKGFFYLLPCIEFWIYQRVEKNGLINGIQEKPYDTINVFIAFLFWSKRVKIKRPNKIIESLLAGAFGCSIGLLLIWLILK